MKLARLLPAVIAVVLAVPGVVLAQDPPAPDGGGGGGGNNRRQRGGRGGMNIADQLKDTLKLTDDQVSKVKAIEDDFRNEMQKQRDDMRNNQGGEQPDWNKMRDKMNEMRKGMQDKVRAILTDEQKPKFEEWVKQQEERMSRFGGGPGGPGGPGGFGRRGPSDEELASRAEKELTLSPDEKSAVMPLVKKVLEARTEARKAQETRREDLKKFLKDVPGTTDAQREEIAGKLKEIKKARDAEEAKIKEAENALREVLTPENEAKLIQMGIL